MKSSWPHILRIAMLCMACATVQAQIRTTPIDQAPTRIAPAVLPDHPRHTAISATASGGSGGISYSGPNGAMNTSPEGASCIVNCGGRTNQHAIDCPKHNTAFCQCDLIPYAVCKPQ